MSSFPEPFSRALVRGCLAVAAALVLTVSSFASPPIGEVGADYSYDLRSDVNWGGGLPPEGVVYTVGSNPLPPGLQINQSSGFVTGVPETAGDYSSTITLSYEGEKNNLTFSFTIDPQTGTPVIDSASAAVGTAGQSFSYTITASENPTAFNVDPDELPNGLSANSTTGEITGTPTESGSFALTISANNAIGTGADFTLTLTINPAGDLPEISSSATLSGDVGQQISYQITASNSPTQYEANNLPFGVDMDDSASGFISGTPTSEGTYQVSIRARNQFGWSDVFTLTITIGDVPQISSSLSLSLQQGVVMDDYLLTASNNPTTFTVSGLPSGLSYNSQTRKITGTPTESGTVNVTLGAINGVGSGPTATLVITIAPATEYVLLRAAAFSVEEVEGALHVHFLFDQSATELATYDYFIETSTDLDTWDSVALASFDNVEVVDKQDGSTSVTVDYPIPDTGDTVRFIRYRVAEKQ